MAGKEQGIYLRGDRYWIQYSFDGKTYRESSGSTSKTVARQLRATRLAEMGSGTLVGPTGAKLTFEQLKAGIIADYEMKRRRSLGRMKSALKNLEEVFGGNRARAITTDRIVAYVTSRQKAGVQDATIQYDIAVLRRAFNLAREDGKLVHVPHFKNLEIENAREGFFTRETMEAVCAKLPPAIAPMARFAFLTGWRKMEVFDLRWSEVYLDRAELRLPGTKAKNKKGRIFPFGGHRELRALIEERRAATSERERTLGCIIPWVFFRDRHRAGKLNAVDPITTITNDWREATIAAGLAGMHFHDFRRSAVRNLEASGIAQSTAMKLTGHKTPDVYRRYNIEDSLSLNEAVAKLGTFHDSEIGKPRTIIPISTGT